MASYGRPRPSTGPSSSNGVNGARRPAPPQEEFYDEDAAAEGEEPEDFADEEQFDPELPPDEPEELEEPEEPVEPEEEEPEEEEDNEQRTREEDIPLEEVPDHMQDAVEGNMKLKRILSRDSNAGDAKRRRVGEIDVKLKQLTSTLTARWGLSNDSATRYVMETAEFSELEVLSRSGFMPNRRGDGKMSPAEQVNNKLMQDRERHGLPGTVLDAVTVFKHRWKLTKEEEQMLRGLGHKDLRHVMNEHDGSRPLQEIIAEAEFIEPEEGKVAHALPNDPGPFTLSRCNRLELIDPVADALVIGDANLTFSLELAKHRHALGHVGRTVATTFEQIDTLRERYPEIDQTVAQLEELECEVLHNVDGTRLAVDTRFQGMEQTFGAVYYNFPHAGVVQGFFDGHPFVRWRHENLMHLFFRAVRSFVKHGGSVKVSSNQGARGVRYSDILTAAATNEFEHVETVPFLEWQLKDYGRSYGDRRDRGRRPDADAGYANQRAQSDMVYCFSYVPSGEAVSKPRIRYPPSKADLQQSNEGKLSEYSGERKRQKVEEMYELFLSYVKGIHIG